MFCSRSNSQKGQKQEVFPFFQKHTITHWEVFAKPSKCLFSLLVGITNFISFKPRCEQISNHSHTEFAWTDLWNNNLRAKINWMDNVCLLGVKPIFSFSKRAFLALITILLAYCISPFILVPPFLVLYIITFYKNICNIWKSPCRFFGRETSFAL